MRAAVAAGLAAALTSAGAAGANCPPPYATVFSCEIPERDARVEFCELPGVTDDPARFTYNYTVGTAPAELFFEADGYYFSTKYYDAPGMAETVGWGLKYGPMIYSVFIYGEYLGKPEGAQIHVYDSVDAFGSEERENESERRYCDPASIRVNWDSIAP